MHPREGAIVGVLVLLVLVPWLGVRDIRRHAPSTWRAAGRSRWTWMLVVVLVPVLGIVLYLRIARPDVRGGPAPRSGVRPR